MSDFNVSSRYAKALLALATETQQFDIVSSDVEFVLNCFLSVKELKVAILSPIIKQEKKFQILEAVFKNKVSERTFEFIKFVLKKNRENLLLNILKRFVELKNAQQGLADIKVKVAFDISDEQKSKLKSKLQSITGKKVSLDVKIDESIIGGFIAKHEDTIYDASVKHSLELLKKKFIQGDFVLN
ncbi:MAG: ATP synthase F1 subunit delta [bacterium]